jgi:hypothetical protein
MSSTKSRHRRRVEGLRAFWWHKPDGGGAAGFCLGVVPPMEGLRSCTELSDPRGRDPEAYLRVANGSCMHVVGG